MGDHRAIAGLIMRGAWPEYASVADAMTFTLPMLLARLAIGASQLSLRDSSQRSSPGDRCSRD